MRQGGLTTQEFEQVAVLFSAAMLQKLRAARPDYQSSLSNFMVVIGHAVRRLPAAVSTRLPA